jgi:hypothetical protein
MYRFMDALPVKMYSNAINNTTNEKNSLPLPNRTKDCLNKKKHESKITKYATKSLRCFFMFIMTIGKSVNKNKKYINAAYNLKVSDLRSITSL